MVALLAPFPRPYWRCYYSNTDAVIYVVDSSDRDRMGISKSELVAMLEVMWTHHLLLHFAVLLKGMCFCSGPGLTYGPAVPCPKFILGGLSF